MSDEPFITRNSNRKRRIVFMNAGKQGAYTDVPQPSAAEAGEVLTAQADGTATWEPAPGGGGGTSFSATTTITNAQLRSTTPVTIVAAPGADKVIVVTTVTYVTKYGGSNAWASNQSFDIRYNNNILVATETPGFTNTDSIYTFDNDIFATGLLSDVANVPLTFAMDVALSGNAANDNTLDVTVWYFVLDI